MISENIDSLIKQSMLSKDNVRTEVLRAIKNEFLIYQTAKNAKLLDNAAEVSILNKMVKQRTESKEQYINGNRPELAEKENAEIDIISEFLPKKASSTEIENTVLAIICEKGWETTIAGPQIPKKSMGEVIKLAKERLNNVDGKQLSEIVKFYIV